MTSEKSLVEDHFAELGGALAGMRAAAPTILVWGHRLAELFRAGGRVLTCGNGGSAAEAQHLSGELVGKFRTDRMPLSAIALHADTSAGTAILNDYGEHEFFARQVRAHGRDGDVLISLSTSGRSENVVAAAKTARQLGMTAWAITGPEPNRLAAICDDSIAVLAANTATVQEVHLAIVHALCAVLDEALEGVL